MLVMKFVLNLQLVNVVIASFDTYNNYQVYNHHLTEISETPKTRKPDANECSSWKSHVGNWGLCSCAYITRNNF